MNVHNTDVFNCCYEIKVFFTVFQIQLMSRYAGAGREHSQTASPSWSVEVVYTL